MNIAGRVNIKAARNTVKLNRKFLHSSITQKVQEDKNEPVILGQKVIKSGNNCTFMATVFVKNSASIKRDSAGACYHVSVGQGFLPS